MIFTVNFRRDELHRVFFFVNIIVLFRPCFDRVFFRVTFKNNEYFLYELFYD